MDFQEWMAEIDKLARQMVGLSIYDFPDLPFRDWYSDEMTPEEAIDWAIDLTN